METGANVVRAALFVRLPAPLLTELDARIAADGRTKQAVVEDILAAQLGTATPPTNREDDPEILDLTDVAALLRVDEATVLDRIRDGDFPARRLGGEWRCARTAVLAWLAGTDPVAPRSTGFASR